MANLDQILDRMNERGGDRLTLCAGRIPAVHAAGRDVPVQKVALAESQIVALVRELAPPHAAAAIDRGQSCSFTYRDFDVRVTFAPSGISVVIAPGDPLALPDDVVPDLSVRAGGRPEAPPALGSGEADRLSTTSDAPAFAPIELDPSAAGGRVSARPAAGVPPSGASQGVVPGPRPPSPPLGDAGSVRFESQAVAPGGFLDDIRSWFETTRSRAIALGVCAAVAVGAVAGVLWSRRPAQIPNVVLADASGRPVSFDDMRGAQARLLVVFLLPNCSMSRFALDSLKEAWPKRSDKLAFVGLYFGNQGDAERYAKDQQIPFPVYGLKDNKDPFLVQEMMKKVGTSDWLVNGIYGGTTFVLDERNKVMFKVEKEGVRELPDKLAALED